MSPMLAMEGHTAWGTSHLVNPLGNTVVRAGSEEALLIAQISTDTVSVIAHTSMIADLNCIRR